MRLVPLYGVPACQVPVCQSIWHGSRHSWNRSGTDPALPALMAHSPLLRSLKTAPDADLFLFMGAQMHFVQKGPRSPAHKPSNHTEHSPHNCQAVIIKDTDLLDAVQLKVRKMVWKWLVLVGTRASTSSQLVETISSLRTLGCFRIAACAHIQYPSNKQDKSRELTHCSWTVSRTCAVPEARPATVPCSAP